MNPIKKAAAVAASLLLTLSACGTVPESSETQDAAEPTAGTRAEAPTTQNTQSPNPEESSEATESPAQQQDQQQDQQPTEPPTVTFDNPAPPPVVDRNPGEFTEAQPSDPFAAYSISFSPGNQCFYYSGGGYFDCRVVLAGNLPALEPGYGAPADQHPDVLMWEDGKGFVVTHDVGGGEGNPPGAQLHPGQRVTAGAFTFIHNPDGTIRVEREDHWFEVSPSGQYSSDRFTP